MFSMCIVCFDRDGEKYLNETIQTISNGKRMIIVSRSDIVQTDISDWFRVLDNVEFDEIII